MMRKALLLPALFLIVVSPIALFVLSGAGTHMSPLLLYPFASPWWAFLPYGDTPGAEVVRLLEGCTINVVLLGCIGFLIDRRARSSSTG